MSNKSFKQEVNKPIGKSLTDINYIMDIPGLTITSIQLKIDMTGDLNDYEIELMTPTTMRIKYKNDTDLQVLKDYGMNGAWSLTINNKSGDKCAILKNWDLNATCYSITPFKFKGNKKLIEKDGKIRHTSLPTLKSKNNIYTIENGGLYKNNVQTNKKELVYKLNDVLSYDISKQNCLILGQSNGICLINLSKKFHTVVAKIMKPYGTQMLYAKNVNYLKLDRRGRLWYLDNGVIKMKMNSGLTYDVLEGKIQDMMLEEVADGIFNIFYIENNDLYLLENVTMIQSGDLGNRRADLYIIELKDGGIMGKYMGFESHIKNVGNANAPAEILGSMDIAFKLLDMNDQEIAMGYKGMTYFTTVDEDWDKSVYDDGYRFPGTEKYTSILPGGIDIYQLELNAKIDISKIKDGEYYYVMILDPYGYYYYQPQKHAVTKRIVIRLSTEGDKRVVKRIYKN